MPTSGLHQRIASVVGDRTYKDVAAMTRTNPATARRYLLGHAPSVEFLQTLCDECKVNAHWLLTGHGPMLAADAKGHALKHANPSELLSAIAEALESMLDRLDRLETFVQTQEARLAARRTGATDDGADDRPGGPEVTTRPAGMHSRRVADAVAQRPPADADPAPPPDDA